jgi:hypothetical protein
MSQKKLLNEEQWQTLHTAYHNYISLSKKKNSPPTVNQFFKLLRHTHSQFKEFSDKQLSNQIIASRNKHGNYMWPNLDDLGNYTPLKARTFIDKSLKSALLAVEIYNKPTIDYRTEGYIVMMTIAWTALFHAIFSKDFAPYKYKVDENEEERYYELSKCVSVYSGILKKEINANLDFLTLLRDQIVHRIIPDLDDIVFGECQACLFNYEQLLNEYFGPNYQIRNSLAYSLQFSKKYTDEQLLAKRSFELKTHNSVLQFIRRYRDELDPDIFQSIHYSFRVFMIPKVGNHIESSDLAVEFIKYDPNKAAEYDVYEKLLYVLREKRVPGEYLKAGEVAKLVYDSLKNTKPLNWKFSASYHHAKCAKYYKIRVGHYKGEPGNTNNTYCIYDPTFNQHIYTKEWVKYLIDKLKDEEQYQRIMNSE